MPRDEDRATVVFDGNCVLCSGWTRFLIRRDRARRLRFATTQSETGSRLLREHGIDTADPASFLLVVGDGPRARAHTASDGVIHILESLGGGWRLASVARIVPAVLRDRLYRMIARNRYAWFGRRTECILPDASDRQRFLL